MKPFTLFEIFCRDLGYALRLMRRSPAFTTISIITLALGIGGNVAIYSVLNGVLIKPLPYEDAERLVGVWHTAPGIADAPEVVSCSPTMFFTYREGSRVFESFGLWTTGNVSVTGFGNPEQVDYLSFTHGVLEALRVQPHLGRWFSEADDTPSTPETLILTHGYWQRRFGGDTSVIGRAITVNSRPREIIGVMPRDFAFLETRADLILPQRFDRSLLFLGQFSYRGIARLKPGVTIEQANTDVARMLTSWTQAWPPSPGVNRSLWENARMTPRVQPLKQEVVGDVQSMLWIFMGTVGIVLFIACANVANLFLSKIAGHENELAVKGALGAAWGRIVRELLIQSYLLSFIGGALGLALAYVGLRFIAVFGPGNLPRLRELSMDLGVVEFAVAVSLLSGSLLGLIPALRYRRTRIAISAQGRGGSQGRRQQAAHSVLVVVQVALALVLLVGSGLMVRTFHALHQVNPGFDFPEQIQLIRVSIPGNRIEPERVVQTQTSLLARIVAIPGVHTAAFTSSAPMDTFSATDFLVAQDRTYGKDEVPPARRFKFVSPGFFDATGTPLKAGRDISWADIQNRTLAAVVSENVARELWGSPAAALGKRIRRGSDPWREIVGVVADVRDNGMHQPAPSIVYWPTIMNNFWSMPTYVARSVVFTVRSPRTGSEAFLKEIQDAVWSVDSNLPLTQVETLKQRYDQSLRRTGFTVATLLIAAVIAMTISIVGIYGVISFVVSQRTREIGIRTALGAQRSQVVLMFVRHALVLAGIGIAVGLAVAAGLTVLMSSLLFGVGSLDPLTYVGVSVIVVAAATLASYLPARRAVTTDPCESLR